MSSTEEKDLLQQITFLSKLINRHKNASNPKNHNPGLVMGHPTSTAYRLIKKNTPSGSSHPSNNAWPSTSGVIHNQRTLTSNQPSSHASAMKVSPTPDSSQTVQKPSKILINPNFKKVEPRGNDEIKLQNTGNISSGGFNCEPQLARPTTILINPNFKGKIVSTTVHVNSKFLNTNILKLPQNPSSSLTNKCTDEKSFSGNNTSVCDIKPIASSTKKYSLKTNRKLVRQLSNQHLPNLQKPIVTKKYAFKSSKKLVRQNNGSTSVLPVSDPLISINNRKLVRLSSKSSLKVAEIMKKQRTLPFKFRATNVTKRRKPIRKSLLTTKKYKYVKRPSFNSIPGRSKLKIDHRPAPRLKQVKKYSLSYGPSTSRKRSWQGSNSLKTGTPNKIYRYRKTSVSSQVSASKPSKFNIQGRKFIMDARGKTLKLVTNSFISPTKKKDGPLVATPLKRIHVAGATYAVKSPNVYVRTNDHTFRNIVSQAKYKSISVLVNKHRKNNQPCIFYRRFGKCIRKEKGTCPCVHDPKQIAICKKFLQGQCEVKGCLLSHDVRPEKMPTCQYFLDGFCTRDPCPYLHVKVNSQAEICHDFLSGYCAIGSLCKKRHVNVCPEFDRSGKCSKGKSCPYPHNKPKRKFVPKPQPPQCVTKSVTEDTLDPSDNTNRYYQQESAVVNPADGASSSMQAESDTDTITPSASKRPKLGTLPAFIPI